MTFDSTPCWDPFVVAPRDQRSDAPRSIDTLEGIGDRLRAAGFAELQAREAFDWAAGEFTDADPQLREAWRGLAKEEDKHMTWLLNRMIELEIPLEDRVVSDQLWVSLRSCKSAREFAIYMASAEERGRRAGERFAQAMAQKDPISAQIFGQIAKEEIEHIQLAVKFFGYSGRPEDRIYTEAWNQVPNTDPAV